EGSLCALDGLLAERPSPLSVEVPFHANQRPGARRNFGLTGERDRSANTDFRSRAAISRELYDWLNPLPFGRSWREHQLVFFDSIAAGRWSRHALLGPPHDIDQPLGDESLDVDP